MSLANKKRRNMIIMIAAVVILLAAFIFIKITTKSEEVVTEDVSYPITTLKSTQISKISYTYKDGAYASYQSADGEWYNADDSEFPLSSSAFEKQFVEKFVEIKASRKLTEYVGGLEALGLNEPELTIDISSFNGEKTNYKLGNYNKTIDAYYLMINDDTENIYMVSEDLVRICRDDIYDFAVVDSFPGFSTTTLKYIEFSAYGQSSKLYYNEEGFEEDITGYAWKWAFGEPFTNKQPCESSKMETLQKEMFDAMAYSKTVNYKASEEELKTYGLSEPRGSYSIFYTDEDENGNAVDRSVTVYIGEYSEDESGFYTREVTTEGLIREVSNTVRILPSTYAEQILAMNPLAYTITNIIYLELTDIDGTYIKYTVNDKEYTYIYGEGEDDEKVSDDFCKLGDKEVDAAGFRDIWAEMVMLEPERIIEDKSALADGPVVYSIFADRNVDDYYGDMTVNFVKYDSTYYQVEINGVTDTLIRKTKVDDFFTHLVEFSEQ